MPTFVALAKTPVERAAALRARACSYDRTAARHARTDKPWTDRNVRLYSGLSHNDWRERSAILRAYLDARATRSKA